MVIALRPVDGVRVTTLIDNNSDALLADDGPVRRWGLCGGAGSLPVASSALADGGRSVDLLRAEHGFSALIEIRVGAAVRRVLYDAGATPDGLVGNLDRLGIDPSSFEAIVCSHGHFDHVMGLAGLARRLGPRGMPMCLHPHFWRHRRIRGPSGVFDLPTPSRAAIEGAGFLIIEQRCASFLLDDALLLTGEVTRVTEFETGMPTHEAYYDDRWQPDPLIHDDQAEVLHVRDKGLVVLTGCAHAGVVNIVRQAMRLTGIDTLCAVLGGFHLRAEPAISAAVAALAAAGPPSWCRRIARRGKRTWRWRPGCRRPTARASWGQSATCDRRSSAGRG